MTAAWNPPFSAVLLDLDGCLLDSNGAHARAWSQALAAFVRELPGAALVVRQLARAPRAPWKKRRR